MREKSLIHLVGEENLNLPIHFQVELFKAMKKLITILLIGWLTQFSSIHAQYLKLLDFNGTNGNGPEGSLTIVNDVLYGMTPFGGANQSGCIFKINPDGTGYTSLLDFSGTSDGAGPNGSLIFSGSLLYGMTKMGGANNMGCIFKIKTDGTGYSKMFDFSGLTNGKYPLGSLMLSGNFLYGMTSEGGNAGKGCIFKISIVNSVFTKLFDFSGTSDGSTPFGSLVMSGNVLYGMTVFGGGNNKGCIFKINTDGSGFTHLHEFSGMTDGEMPYGSLILSGNILYGMTIEGGANNEGCIFSINTDGSGYSIIFDFNDKMNGAYFPGGSLTLIENILFGMTTVGGTYGYGSIFQFDAAHDGCSRLLDFNGAGNGNDPHGDLTLSGSALYGMTSFGGSYDLGVIFKYILKPFTQAGNIIFPFVGIDLADISWTNGSGEKRAVFIKKGTGAITYPVNNTTYTASNDWNTKGSQLGTSGYYCIYNDTGNNLTITGLSQGTTYTVQVFEYNGEAGEEHYQLMTETGNPNSFQTTSVTTVDPVRRVPEQIYSDGKAVCIVMNQRDVKAQIAIYNVAGVCLFRTDKLNEGLNRIAIDCLPGIYIVNLTANGLLLTKKIMID
jgi:uncharacterized repeat protein (TIGR03803 family)